jgi:hypothetical protein
VPISAGFDFAPLTLPVEPQGLDDDLLRLLRLLRRAEKEQRVERVDGRHQQRLGRMPVLERLRQRLELVVTPRVLLVGVPRLEERGAHARGHVQTLGGGPSLAAERRGRDENEEDCGANHAADTTPEP